MLISSQLQGFCEVLLELEDRIPHPVYPYICSCAVLHDQTCFGITLSCKPKLNFLCVYCTHYIPVWFPVQFPVHMYVLFMCIFIVLYCADLWHISVQILFNIIIFTCCISWCFFSHWITYYDFFYEIIANTGLRFSEIDLTIFDGLIVCKHTFLRLHQISKPKTNHTMKKIISLFAAVYLLLMSLAIPYMFLVYARPTDANLFCMCILFAMSILGSINYLSIFRNQIRNK